VDDGSPSRCPHAASSDAAREADAGQGGAEVPDGSYLYEPKWDGFRCVVFRDGDEVELGSRNEKPLTRYFPEVVEAVRAQLPERCVVDGEIVIAAGQGLDFEALLQRIHPAASRVKMLAETTPASFVAFDLLALDGESLVDRRSPPGGRPWSGAGRRRSPGAPDARHVRPRHGTEWFTVFEGPAWTASSPSRSDGAYAQDKRTLLKIKHARTADCVVGAFRWHKSGRSSAPWCSACTTTGPAAARRRRRQLPDGAPCLAGRRARALPPGGGPAAPVAGRGDVGAGTRRRAVPLEPGQGHVVRPLRPELVVEVAYDHMEGARFRHTAQFRNWRPDRDAASCTYDQLQRPVRFDLATVLSS
jgi:hypothetical protein